MKPILIALLLFALIPQASAYLSTFDTADSLGKDKQKIGFESQYIYNDFAGVNGTVRYDYGLSDEETAKFEIGTGSVNFNVGLHYKYSPVPDMEGQAAIGAFFGIVYAVKDGAAMTSLRLHPILSKKFDKFTPYLALPFGVTFGSGSTTVPFHITIGTEWRPVFLAETWFFTLELGSEVSQSFSYGSLGLSHNF
ncbi:MAG: hypothetical protein IPM57_02255 [Oligoflexia bacterium]|nr:hypothetical protein [Oligoflexia bacterium]